MTALLLKTDVASKLIEELNTETVFNLFGGKLKIDEGTVVSWIIMAVFLIAGILLTRGLKVEGKLSKRQLFIEMCVDKMRTFFHNVMGPDGDRYIPWMMTVAVYIGACNMCGIFGFKSPTKELNVTVGLALTSIILVQYAGIHKRVRRDGLSPLLSRYPSYCPSIAGAGHQAHVSLLPTFRQHHRRFHYYEADRIGGAGSNSGGIEPLL